VGLIGQGGRSQLLLPHNNTLSLETQQQEHHHSKILKTQIVIKSDKLKYHFA